MEFINLSTSHGVLPLVYHTLKNYQQYIPKDIFQQIQSINLDIVKQNMLMTSELIKVMKLLAENGIEAIAFKGPTLAQMAYGDITLRQYSDLDILLRKDDIYTIYNLLKKDYTRNLELKPLQEEIWFKYAHDLGLTNNKNGVHIEFHWSMLDTDHPISLKNIDFFKDMDIVDIKNRKVNIISNEKFLIYLCIHGAKHLFERIEWVIDIDRFIRAQKLDWNKILKIVEKDNSKKFFILGLYKSNILYDTPIPKEFRKYFDDDIKSVSNHIFSGWNRQKEFNNKTNLKYRLKLFVSNKDKLSYIYKIYLKPTFTEYWYITFPKPLYFLYYPLRQYLLVKKYFFDKK